jgi:histone demethylase JARID1
MRDVHSTTPSHGSANGWGRSPRAKMTSSASPPLEEEEESLVAARNATFTTCLSIPVQGATPIEAVFAPNASRMSRAQPQITAPTKRAARKSKLDALAAIHSRLDSSSPEPDEGFRGYDTSLRKDASVPVMPELDMSSVRTTSPRNPTTDSSRPFGLQDCPTYYPSAEQFRDPMSYIDSIAAEASQYGICKIVPPEGWKMPFVTDTKVQYLLLSLTEILTMRGRLSDLRHDCSA